MKLVRNLTILIITFLLVFAACEKSKSEQDLSALTVVTLNNKFGLADSNGKIVIPPEYEFVSGFDNATQLCRVVSGGKHGWIDVSNYAVIPLEYDDASDFTDGQARVFKDGEWSYIDTAGKTVNGEQ
ncbi:MAG: WG repeat-containing protein [Oscillospiraceae bacterium]|jgi:hypothetical protein|nr:WG repeat-containing protein [Oscillospiraceae bacterium]